MIREELARLSAYEKTGETKIDEPAGCFGRLMAEIFIYGKDNWEEYLRPMGFYLGKYIYIMDAYDDLKEDIKEDNYNPLKAIYEDADYEEQVLNMLRMMLGECTLAFERLPLIEDIDILRNILYDGVWKRYRKLKEQEAAQHLKQKL